MSRIIISILVGLAFLSVDAGETCAATGHQEVAREGDSKPDTLVLCPIKFQPAIKQWTEYRSAQGHKIVVLSPAPSSVAILQQIKQVAQSGSLKNVLIVGDSGDEQAGPGELVTTDYVAAKVTVLFGSEPEIATDNTYADLDQDGIPDLTIGRIPADTVEEIRQYTNRIIAYESHSDHPSWQRRINFVAGVGGFGQVIDRLIEQTTLQIITDLIPGGYETKMTYGSWCSPYCPDPRRFSESAIKRFNEGCMFWVYIGHGDYDRLDNVYMPDQRYAILDNSMVPKLTCDNGSPIAVFLACYTGAADNCKDCLAETMLRQPKGPIAAICGTRMTMPYAMSLLSLEMVHEYFEGDAKTIGELMMLAKQRLVNGSNNNPDHRNMIEGMGKTFSPTPKLLTMERLEHVQLIHLIGDPLLRLKRPEKIEVQTLETATAGTMLSVRGNVPAAGNLIIELAYERDRLKDRRPRRKEYVSSEESFRSYQQIYERALDLVCAKKVIPVSEGKFESEIVIPQDTVGRCVVRAMLDSGQVFALGSSPISIKKNPSLRSAKKSSNQVK